jgi:methylglutaconyl-CoA hydratase
MGESVEYQVNGGVAWITLNRPDNHNAMTSSLTSELDEAFELANKDAVARIIVFGARGRTFCAGADLKSRGKGAIGVPGRYGASPYVSILTQIMDGAKPVVGRIQGSAFAGGLGLVAACDVAVCVEAAHFAYTEVRLGLAPWMLSVVLERKGALKPSAPYLLNGEKFDAHQAKAMNLIARVVPEAALDQAVQEEIDRFLLCAPNALIETKRIFRTVPTMPMAEAFTYAERASRAMFEGEEGQEGMAAFKEKRKPRWVP